MAEPNDEFLDPLPERRLPGISWVGVFLGLMLGVAAGLFYTQQIDPIVVRNADPDDLRPQDKQMYVIAAAQEYALSGNLGQVVDRLLDVDPQTDPFQLAADTACALTRSGQVNSRSNLEVIRNLRALYEPQGVVANCDISLANTAVPITIVVPTASITPTATITPVASKTPTPEIDSLPINTPIPTITPASEEGTSFREAFVEQYCDENLSGLIEIYVRDTNGQGIPGTPILVTWNNAQQRQVFYTGLKPERGDDYADFEMEEGQVYTVGVLNQGQASRPLDAAPCDDLGTLISYRVVIQRAFNQRQN